jgi:hypothetical protein
MIYSSIQGNKCLEENNELGEIYLIVMAFEPKRRWWRSARAAGWCRVKAKLWGDADSESGAGYYATSCWVVDLTNGMVMEGVDVAEAAVESRGLAMGCPPM